MDKETLNGLIPFQLTGDLSSFEERYMPLLQKEYSITEQQARNLISSIWLLANEQFAKGYKAIKNKYYV